MSFTIKRLFSTAAVCAVLVAAASASAATISIDLLGLDLVYDGTTITGADVSPIDDLTAVALEVDGSLAGPILSSPPSTLTAAIEIPVAIPVTAPGSSSVSVSGAGFLDLFIDGTPSLLLDIEDVGVTFFNAGVAQFVFGATVSTDVVGQDLPYGLVIGEPVEVSLLATVVPGTLVDDGSFYTAFDAAGSATITGEAVPEPATMVLLAILSAFGSAVALRQRLG